MSLIYCNPFRELSSFDWPTAPVLRGRPSGAAAAEAGKWAPVVDVYETNDHALVVSAELPGIAPSDVSVTVANGVLTIAGERQVDNETNDARWYRTERAYGSFHRSFSIPRTVDTAAVTAEHKDGTLRVRLPLKAEVQPHPSR